MLPEAELTGGIASEENETLDGFLPTADGLSAALTYRFNALQDQAFFKNHISGPTIFELLTDAQFMGYPCPMCFKFEKCNPQ
jgi:hypothetical protein